MRTRSKMVRILVALGVLALAVASAHFEGALPVGTLCLACPVGFAQVAAASQSIPWQLLPGVAAVLVIVLLLGRVFCSWVCPSQLLKNVFGGRAPRGILGRSGTAPAAGCATCSSASGASLKTQGVVLAVLLAVSFVVRSPVFCLLCPIGLVFGTLWALNRVFVLLQPGWELIVFPLMLLAELFLFKRWCAAICPLGFFFGLAGKVRARLGLGVRPVADRATCHSNEGCRTCSTVCSENLDVAHADASVLEACTLCGDCVENCPTKSLKLSFGSAKSPAPAAAPASDEDLAKQ